MRIDLNSDMGEGFGPWRMGDDEAMLSIVTSANVACGWHAGDPLKLSVSVSPKGPVREIRLGPDVIGGDRAHYVVGAHEWQAAVPLPGQEGYTLVSCVVTPGFKMSGFTLAPPNWRPGN